MHGVVLTVWARYHPRIQQWGPRARDERVRIYGEAQELIVEELPCLFLYVPIEFEVIRFNVENWVYSPSQTFEFNEIFKE